MKMKKQHRRGFRVRKFNPVIFFCVQFLVEIYYFHKCVIPIDFFSHTPGNCKESVDKEKML